MSQNEPIPLISEFSPTNENLNDVALRTQQILIALQTYENQLIQIESMLPGLKIEGYDLKEIPLYWNSSAKNPDELAWNVKKSVTFVLLAALNQHIYMLDRFMSEVLRKYYNAAEDVNDFINPEMFSLLTGIDLTKVPFNDNIIDLRKTASLFREVKKTHAINIPEYFEAFQQVCRYIHSLSMIISEKVWNDKKKGDKNE